VALLKVGGLASWKVGVDFLELLKMLGMATAQTMQKMSQWKELVVPPRKAHMLMEGLGMSPWIVEAIHAHNVKETLAQPMIIMI